MRLENRWKEGCGSVCGGRQTAMQEKESGEVAHVHCGLGGRRQFITSPWLPSVNCWKFTFYTTPSGSAGFDESHGSRVNALNYFGVRTERELGGTADREMKGRRGVDVWV